MAGHSGAWEVSAKSDRGHVREHNEDRMTAACFPWGQVFIVADGMGGHKGGALAAELAVQGLVKYLSRALPGSPTNEAIDYAFEKTNRIIYKKAHSGDPETKSMGSTVVLLLVVGSATVVAHVGDSRAYLYRKRQLHRLTKDHSAVQRMIDAGMISAEEARDHPDASVIYRAMGDKPQVEVDIGTDLQLNPGDGILLCSDGLCGYVDDKDIRAVLRSKIPVEDIADRLVELGLKAGGEDNITVQFIQYGKRIESLRLHKRLLYRINPAMFSPVAGSMRFGKTLFTPQGRACASSSVERCDSGRRVDLEAAVFQRGGETSESADAKQAKQCASTNSVLEGMCWKRQA